ncbi:homing endonuclease associated repeat-containing protein [Ruminococcus callidus]|jgi:hypothetical protein
MKFELNDFHRNTSDEELLNDLKAVSNIINKDTVTMEEYNQYGKYHSTTLTRRFGSWFLCLQKAQLQMSRSKIGISNEALFDNIEKVWIKLGKQPSYTQMEEYGEFSIGTYTKRFGGWRKALEAFVDYVNSTEIKIDESEPTSDTTSDVANHITRRDINLRMRFIVMKRDNFKCCMCGRSPATTPGLELHIDHIIPWSKGGETVIDNLQTLCSDCNLGKSNLSETE